MGPHPGQIVALSQWFWMQRDLLSLPVQNSAEQCRTVQNSAEQNSTVQYRTEPDSLKPLLSNHILRILTHASELSFYPKSIHVDLLRNKRIRPTILELINWECLECGWGVLSTHFSVVSISVARLNLTSHLEPTTRGGFRISSNTFALLTSITEVVPTLLRIPHFVIWNAKCLQLKNQLSRLV